MDAAAESGRNPLSKHQIQPEYGDEQADAGWDWLNPSRETKFSGTHGDRGIFIFPVQLTTSRIGNLTRLIHTLLYVMTIHTYIHTAEPISRDRRKREQGNIHFSCLADHEQDWQSYPVDPYQIQPEY